mgnify:CR=1 FL=1
MKKKSLFLVISLLLVIIAVVVCFNLNKTTNKNKENDLIISDIRNNDHIQLSMQKLSNDISGVTVQATVNPSSVVDNTLNWTLSWKTTNSNNINDYVSMQVSADTQSVTLTYIKQFETQIILKATSALTPGVSAQCSIDCYKRVKYSGLSEAKGYINGEAVSLTVDEQNKTIDCSGYSFAGMRDDGFNNFGSSYSSKGTINTTITMSMKLVVSEDLKSALTSKSLTLKQTEFICNDSDLYDFTLKDIMGIIVNLTNDAYTAFSEVNHWFDLIITFENKYNSQTIESLTYTYQLINFDISDGLSVNSINLNQSTIIF